MKKALPLSLTALVVIADQLSKAWIVSTITEGTVAYRLLGDFLWICHVRNDAVAFSMGAGLPEAVKAAAFIVIPLVLMALVIASIFTDRIIGKLTSFQRWCLAGIAGGGIGNLIDRVFRSFRVVDWISTDNYGWFGMERFPTYNIADAAIVISVVLLVASILIGEFRKNAKQES